MSPQKIHNSPRAAEAKLQLRRNVLAHVPTAHVFDAFCGPVGEMYEGVWKAAASYVGVDVEWRLRDPRRRFVADNLLVMRSIDLQAFNVFDFDAFGSPWDQMATLLARRTWSAGEVGAVVLTDGGERDARCGELSASIARLAGVETTQSHCSPAGYAIARRFATKRWIDAAKVRPLKSWDAKADGPSAIYYSAIVFEGTG